MFPSELVVAKTKLESEGIECRVLNELTVQSYNFLSNAVGGVKLQVQISDFDKATKILEQGGFIKENSTVQLNFLERKLGDPKFYKIVKKSLTAVSILFGFFVISLLFKIYLNKPSDYERLIGEYWCVDYVYYKDYYYYPKTLSDKIRFRKIGQCDELIIFDSTGIVQFPGFNTGSFQHQWKLRKDQIIISSLDTMESDFYGTYDYDMSNYELVMTSDSLEIVCIKP